MTTMTNKQVWANAHHYTGDWNPCNLPAIDMPPLNKWLSVYDHEPAVGHICTVETLEPGEAGMDFGGTMTAIYMGNGKFGQMDKLDKNGDYEKIPYVFAYMIFPAMTREERNELLEKFYEND